MQVLLSFRFLIFIFLSILLTSCGGGSGNSGSDTSPSLPSVPVVDSFIADPGYLVSGTDDTAILSWSVTGANTVTISPEVGIVEVTSGSFSVHPTQDTEYTLVAENGQGQTTAKVTVTIGTLDASGSEAYGNVPAGLPPRLAVGLVEEPRETWMLDSGVSWDMRYHYFTKGWRDNWGWDTTNSGEWGMRWLNECDSHGFLPVIQYYCMNNEPGGGEGQFYEKTRNAATMASYFDDFKVLMQRAKEFDKPVLVLMEADGYGYMELQTEHNPDAYSAIADSGMPELADLPNTAAGWGLAFLQIREAVGADKVILGMHISGWTTGNDIAYYQTDLPLQTEVNTAYAFLSELGLKENQTGATYDVLVSDPLDRDSDYYRVVRNQERWWDADDTASINSASFNRYAEWLKLWNIKSSKRWVLWQIPLGNSNHLNVQNNGEPRQGYKDNRPEYFFGDGLDHMRKFADAGTIALLFGPGLGGLSYYTNDIYTDGQLFMKSRAGAILNAGGLPIVTVGQ